MADTKLVICEKCWGTGHVHGGEENSTWSKTCEDCRGIGFVRVPMTNADHIRAMSDEELADFITSRNRGICTDICMEMYYQSSLVWLKQPAE